MCISYRYHILDVYIYTYHMNCNETYIQFNCMISENIIQTITSHAQQSWLCSLRTFALALLLIISILVALALRFAFRSLLFLSWPKLPTYFLCLSKTGFTLGISVVSQTKSQSTIATYCNDHQESMPTGENHLGQSYKS